MSSGDVALTAALRSNLLSLQSTQKLIDQTQLRLATGLRVNSPLDDPQSFFAAQALNNRGSDLSRLLDDQGQAVQKLQAAGDGIDALTSLLEQAQSIATEAKAVVDADPDAGGLGLNGASQADVDAAIVSFNEVLSQINGLAGDASYRGTNLVQGTATLTVTFSETSTPTTHDVTGIDFAIDTTTNTQGLDFTTDVADNATGGAGIGWDEDYADKAFTSDAIQASLDSLKVDLATLRATASSFGASLNIIQTRQDFTNNLINTLRGGADKLTLADKNEEGAKLLALQTSQSLGITSLSLASQSNQAILRLFG